MALTCCTKPYNPPAIKGGTGYLVVEGVINPGNDTTRFHLSRTVSLNNDSTTAPVAGAVVTVQGNDNTSYPLTGNSKGIYTVLLNLNTGKQYRVDIKTPGGKEYQSDYVPVKITPPIDTISYAANSTGNSLQLNLSAHDGTNNTRYYRWDFDETWRFHAYYNSVVIMTFDPITNSTVVVPRPVTDSIYYCFNTDSSTNVLLGSSAKLTHDVISNQLIQVITSTSEKLEIEYSIIVHQYALTSDAYSFWSILKTNTEELGGIFDPQPSQLSSNIHCLNDANEPVIGYISASTVSSKRLFINSSALPGNWKPVYPYTCETDSAVYGSDAYTFLIETYEKGYIPIFPILNAHGAISGATYSTSDCADCTIRGTVKQPSFWR